MIARLVLTSIAVFLPAYFVYGRFLAKRAGLDNGRVTPACRVNDGVDYVPAKPSLLLGQHFSAIAAAGPIVGPILACLWFGWLPAVLWIIIGAIFVGGVHDFFSLTGSMRHGGASIGEIVKIYMSPSSHKLFLAFVWLALIYVIIAFTDITAQTFKTVIGDASFGAGVAASSLLYLLAAVVMGVLLYKFRLPLGIATAMFFPIVLFIVWIGPRLPSNILALFSGISLKQWDIILLAYCLIASLIPVWLLLQPRGYLGGLFLYAIILIGLAGALLGGFKIEYPAINMDGLRSAVNGKALFPVLFITIACGACSGFHGIVSSGTTSKQVDKDKNALVIGYGGMLLEALVAVLAIATVIMLPAGSKILKSDPNLIYANGIAKYLSLIKIDYNIALPFALLAFSTFVYDTLDVCTRLARYILQELTGWRSRAGAFWAAAVSLIVPLAFLLFTKEKSYLVAWPIFGTSNQLLASMILLAVSVWLIDLGRRPLYTILPMAFMLAITFWSLLGMIGSFFGALSAGIVTPESAISGICALVLLFLSLMLVRDAGETLCKGLGLFREVLEGEKAADQE